MKKIGILFLMPLLASCSHHYVTAESIDVLPADNYSSLNQVEDSEFISNYLNNFNCYFDDIKAPGEGRYNATESIFDDAKYYGWFPFEKSEDDYYYTVEATFNDYYDKYFVCVLSDELVLSLDEPLKNYYESSKKSGPNTGYDYIFDKYYNGIPFLLARQNNRLNECKWYEMDNLDFFKNVNHPEKIALVLKQRSFILNENLTTGDVLNNEYKLLERSPILISNGKESYSNLYQFEDDLRFSNMQGRCIFNIEKKANLNNSHYYGPKMMNENISCYFRENNNSIYISPETYNILIELYGEETITGSNIQKGDIQYSLFKEFVKSLHE